MLLLLKYDQKRAGQNISKISSDLRYINEAIIHL